MDFAMKVFRISKLCPKKTLNRNCIQRTRWHGSAKQKTLRRIKRSFCDAASPAAFIFSRLFVADPAIILPLLWQFFAIVLSFVVISAPFLSSHMWGKQLLLSDLKNSLLPSRPRKINK